MKIFDMISHPELQLLIGIVDNLYKQMLTEFEQAYKFNKSREFVYRSTAFLSNQREKLLNKCR